MEKNRILYLMEAYLAGEITEDEKSEFFATIGKDNDEKEIKDLLAEFMKEERPALYNHQRLDVISESILSADKVEGNEVLVFRFIKWAAAASIILVLGIASYFVLFTNERKQAGGKGELVATTDVRAPTGRAVITLADGRKVYLDSVGTGTLATQANITVEKSADGKIVYQPAGGITTEVVYNTLTNPRGSKVIDMQLTDGSRVWLDAGSSVKYPVAFAGNERKVEITGEAYFEVTHDATKPFIVSNGEVNVQVLGTHFNVNAYDDEEALKVTLLEGSVVVKRETANLKLKPGEQAIVNRNATLTLNRSVDTEKIMAWKNGKFAFGENTGIKEIMRELSRWYDVEVIYQDNIQQEFGGSMSRQSNISQVLDKLELTGKVHFKIEGKRIIVMR
jgi:transmembrane sensor